MKATRSSCRLLQGALVIAYGQVCAQGAGAADLIDPTQAPAPPPARRTAVAAASLPRVTAIFRGDERSIAIFDGQPVQAGDQVGNYYIEAVTPDGVRYRIGTQVAFAALGAPLADRPLKDQKDQGS
jgi:hypothetical protein